MIGDINTSFATVISLFSGSSPPTLGPGTAGALVVGQFWLNTSVTPNVLNIYDGVAWDPVGTLDAVAHTFTAQAGPLSWRNILVDNGGLEVWQRGAGSSASFAVGASSTAYTADRWYLTTGANQASVVAAVAGLTNGSSLAAKVTRNSGQTGITAYTFGFPLDTDEVARMRGSKVTISATVKSGANWSPSGGTVTMTLYVGTGAVAKRGGGFAGETNVVSQSAGMLTNTQVGPAQGFVATSAAVVPANATQGELQFTWTPVGTAGADDSITIDDVQLEVTPFGSAFERAPFDISLLRCKRHFWKTFLYGTAPVTNAGVGTGELQAAAGKTTLGGIFPRNPVSMRATPSVITFNPAAANAAIRDETAPGDTTGTAVANATTEGFQVTATGGIGAAGNTLGVHLTADAGI
jgi:hypothetical protein